MQAASAPFECCRCGKVESAPFLSGISDRLGITKQNYDYRRCLACGLIALFPRPSFEQTKSFYPNSFWRTDDENERELRRAKRLEAWIRNRLVMADFHLVADLFDGGVRHLDVGCATGDFICSVKREALVRPGSSSVKPPSDTVEKNAIST